VKQAFRRLAAKSHPDRFPNASTEERGRLMRDFAELSCAYHALIA
jgi:DnaJ-class molecular chaperone